MPGRILITGGAGFIGAHVAHELLQHGYRVRALDSLLPQVHGPSGERPGYLHPEVELVRGDVRDREAVRQALQDVEAVYHFAARVGVGQSMYELVEYTDVNESGTAQLLEALIERPVRRLVVASSMSVYGEGLYRSPDGQLCEGERTTARLRGGDWGVYGAQGELLQPVPTPESKRPAVASVYALNKLQQEQMCLLVGAAYGIPTVALRFFNAYGPYQALSNPYTGVLAIFASRLLNGRPPLVYEDGEQQRDFVHVSDVALGCRLALERPEASGKVINIGSGRAVTVCEVARRMAAAVGVRIEPTITGTHRTGDIRNCFADIGLAREVLGYEPQMTFEQGLEQLADWLAGQTAVDRISQASEELTARGLTI
jgi:dTDP-L-rhamnose 4-epimerase